MSRLNWLKIIFVTSVLWAATVITSPTQTFTSLVNFEGTNAVGPVWQQVPGLLSQIALGSAGSVWGTNSADQIYWFDPQTQSWDLIPGQLGQIAVASDGTVWGINSAQQIYRFNPLIQSWDHIPGALARIAVGSAGVVWGINAAQETYRFNPGTGGWDRIPGALAQIAVGADGSAWGLNAQHQVSRFNPQTQAWEQIPGLLTQIAVGSANAVWGIDAQQQIYHYNPQTQGWDKIPGALAQITVGANGAVWGINAAQQIFTFNEQTQTFKQIPGALTQLAVGVDGSVWGINAQQQIYALNVEPSRTRTWEQMPGQLAQVAVSVDGAVWGINSAQQIFAFNARTQSWNQVPGLLAQIAVGFGGAVWGINAAQEIYRFNVQTQTWDHIPGLLKQIAVGSANAVWGLNAQQQIFRYNPQTQGWQQIPGLLAQIAVGADGCVWGINSAGQIYRFNSQTKGWDPIPGVPTQIAVGSANVVWGINPQQQIYRYNPHNPPSQPWDWIPGALTQIAVAYDGVVWGLNSAQEIFTFDAQTQTWEQVPGLLARIAVGSDGVVWGTNSSQQIFAAKLEVPVPSFEMPPSAPTNLGAAPLSTSSISLTWNDNSENETGFAVEQSTGGGPFSQVLSVGANQEAATVKGLTPATSYTYRIRAFNNSGNSGFSNTATAVTHGAAPVLSGPQTAATGTFTVTWAFKWPSIVTTNDGYSLEESKTSATEGFAVIYSTVYQNDHRTQVDYVVSVNATGTYWYRVRARSGSSFTPYSNVILVQVTLPETVTRFINNTSYFLISLRVDGTEYIPAPSASVLSGSYMDIPLSQGQHNYTAQNGFWDGSSRFSMYQWSGTYNQPSGKTFSIKIPDPTIYQILTKFSGSTQLWEGEWWDANFALHSAGFRFTVGGTWTFYVDGKAQGTGKYSLVSRNPSSFSLTFTVGNYVGTYSETEGYFFMKNGPPSWPLIKYYPVGL